MKKRSGSLRLLVLLAVCARSAPAQVKTVAERLGYPADSKLLIIMADDVGVAHAINRAAFAALDQGAVTSGTVQVISPGMTEVAEYATQHPEADLGVHLSLTDGWKTYRFGPAASRERVPSLLDSHGYFFESASDVLRSAKPGEVETELRAQIDRARQFGLRSDFLDSHQRVLHSTPELFQVMTKVAHDYHLPFLTARNNQTGGRWLSLLSDKDIVVDALFIIPSNTPREDWMNFYTRTIRTMKLGLNEIYVHPAFDDAEFQAVMGFKEAYGPAWRQRDFNVVTSQEFKNVLQENHIILVH